MSVFFKDCSDTSDLGPVLVAQKFQDRVPPKAALAPPQKRNQPRDLSRLTVSQEARNPGTSIPFGQVNGLTVKSASHEVDIQKNSDAGAQQNWKNGWMVRGKGPGGGGPARQKADRQEMTGGSSK